MPKNATHYLFFALALFAVAARGDGVTDQDPTPAPAISQSEFQIISDDVRLPSGLIMMDDSGGTPLPDAENPANGQPTPQAAAAAPPPANDLWQRIRNGYGMNDLQSPFTATHEAWYAARPEYMQRMVSRSQLYLYHVVEEVQKRGMPTEIALLPMIESAFNPEAYSRSKASGIWQFIPSTGKHFGLKQDWWADNRRDVTAATDAALTYLNKLHVMFGTWELALAAYNAGEGTVQRAIDRNRSKGLPTDYQSLNLPEETKEYVPKLQAVKNIISNPQQYGLEIKTIANQPYFTKVNVSKRMDVKLAAKLAGVSTSEFTQLNPAYRRPVMTGGNGSSILLPIGKEGDFTTNLANYNQPLSSWQTHYTKRGERLSSVAKRYGISVAQLQEVNDISGKQRLKPNQPILVPMSDKELATVKTNGEPEKMAEQMMQPAAAPAPQRYAVKKGDTLASIARNNGLTAKQLMALNHLKSSKLRQGQVLAVNQTNTQPASKAATKVAKRTASGKLAKADNKTPRNKESKTRYVIKRGETLASIARKFSVATGDLQRWNNISGSRIVPGRTLTIYRPDA